MAERAFDRGLGSGETPEEAQLVETLRHAPERRWPARRRFLFIVAAATLCWAIPAMVAYLVLSHY